MNKHNLKVRIITSDPASPAEFSYAEVLQQIRADISQANYGNACSLARTLANNLPDDEESYLVATESHVLNQDYERAKGFAERLLQLSADPCNALLLLSRIALCLNQQQLALEHIEKAVKLNPGNTLLLLNKGDIYLALGKSESAREAYLQSLEADSRNIKSLLALSLLPGEKFDDKKLRKIEFIASSNQLSTIDQGYVHFALANVYERRGDTPLHFRHLHAGNSVFCKLYQFNPDNFRRQVADIKSLFSSEFFEAAPQVTASDRRILFVVGMPRSGSTLVEQILSSHSMVGSTGESAYLNDALLEYAKQQKQAFPNFAENIKLENLEKIADSYLARANQLSSMEVITDKTLNNYLFVGMIHLLFPRAKILHIKRHPVAACYGCYKKVFSQGSITFSYSLEHLSAYHRAYTDLMDHWDRVLPGKILNLEYESLVENQELFTRSLLKYCDLPWEDNCLNYQDNSQAVRTSSSIQVKRGIYTTAVDQWREYEEYLQPVMSLIDTQLENG